MAYGKDPNQLKNVQPYGGNLSQRARALATAQRAPRTGGGGGLFFTDNLKIPLDHSRFLRLIPGEYTQSVSFDHGASLETGVYEYLMYREHFHGVNGKSAICSAGPLYESRTNREPCHGCSIYWEDWENNRGKKRAERTKRISMRDMFAFTVWDYGLWLKIPRRGDDGKDYYDWVPAPNGDPRVNQFEHKYGRLVPWPMGKTYKDYLIDYNDKTVRHDCATCGSRGTVYSVCKICSNCEAEIYDCMNSTLTLEQRESIDNNPKQECKACGHVGFINEMISCSVCEQKGTVPRRASIFDIDMEVTATGTKGDQTHLQILNRSEPRPIQVFDAEILKTIQPLSLDKKFAPTSLENQQRIWNIQVVPQMTQAVSVPQQQPPPQQYAPPPQMPTMGAAVGMAMPGMVAPQPMSVPAMPVPMAAPPMPVQQMPGVMPGGMPGVMPGMPGGMPGFPR